MRSSDWSSVVCTSDLNITTDHLSPSNAIMANSAAGEYLAKMGLPEEDFNSYATHRGDHLTAQRATFANPKLLNEMVKENGQVKQGSLARIEPEGRVTRLWERSERRRVGKEGVSTCRSLEWPYNQ